MALIDPALVGLRSEPVTVEVEKGAIRRFAEALGETNPVYFDEAAARAAGYRSLLAPPTFPVTLGRVPVPGLVLPPAGLIHGEQAFEYGEPIVAGDVITLTSMLEDVKTRSGRQGTMTILTLRTEGVNQSGALAFVSRATIIVTEQAARVAGAASGGAGASDGGEGGSV
ncbi:MAG: MaoC family dehydratase N-terminal domain-containing protein [Actinomycetia bacterium]|nr:MaoC family dehydratase N-terminal domain-containing protein [Actinomycetes bacterium]